jgi:8-hydroxy-5-deazaflavin:NADPH oxidoreductase
MKKIGVLGTGMVGNSIATKLVELGYEVKIGSRTADNKNALEWVKNNGKNASNGTFNDAAGHGEIIFLCLKGDAEIPVVKSIKPEFLNGKTVVDIANPLDFSKGMPPSLIDSLSNTTSLGEQLQIAIPEAHIVKTLNIVNCDVMINPGKIKGTPTMFVSGDNDKAKLQVTGILKQFGWTDIIDLGGLNTARGTEMLVPLWVTMMMKFGNPDFAFKVVR